MNPFDPATDDDLVAYLDGALDDAAAARVRERLAADPAFARRAAELEAVDRLLGALDDDAKAPPGLAERVVAEAGRAATADRFRRRMTRAAAAAAVIATLGVFASRPGGGGSGGGTDVGATPAVAALADYAALAPAAASDDFADVEDRLALIESVEADYFSG